MASDFAQNEFRGRGGSGRILIKIIACLSLLFKRGAESPAFVNMLINITAYLGVKRAQWERLSAILASSVTVS